MEPLAVHIHEVPDVGFSTDGEADNVRRRTEELYRVGKSFQSHLDMGHDLCYHTNSLSAENRFSGTAVASWFVYGVGTL